MSLELVLMEQRDKAREEVERLTNERDEWKKSAFEITQQANKTRDELTAERDEARAEVERLKDHIPAATKMIRPEPSRLEIAAMFMARPEWGYTAGQALKVADLLIAAAKGGAE